MGMNVTAALIYGFPLPKGTDYYEAEPLARMHGADITSGGYYCVECNYFAFFYIHNTYDCEAGKIEIPQPEAQRAQLLAAAFGVDMQEVGWWLISSYG